MDVVALVLLFEVFSGEVFEILGFVAVSFDSHQVGREKVMAECILDGVLLLVLLEWLLQIEIVLFVGLGLRDSTIALLSDVGNGGIAVGDGVVELIDFRLLLGDGFVEGTGLLDGVRFEVVVFVILVI